MEKYFDKIPSNQINFGKNNQRLRIYCTEPPSFGTLTSPYESNVYFFPFKTFNKDKYRENYLSFDKLKLPMDAFHLMINNWENSDLKSK